MRLLPFHRTCLAIALSAGLMTGCGEVGSDQNGPIKAYLIVKRPTGERADFYLGGYNSQADCTRLLVSEVGSYEKDQGGEFWTNPAFTYGGFKQKGWEQNTILGSMCMRH